METDKIPSNRIVYDIDTLIKLREYATSLEELRIYDGAFSGKLKSFMKDFRNSHPLLMATTLHGENHVGLPIHLFNMMVGDWLQSLLALSSSSRSLFLGLVMTASLPESLCLRTFVMLHMH